MTCLTVAAHFSAYALEYEVWISPLGPAQTVETNTYSSGGIIGTPTYPLRCPDPGTFNWVMTHDLTNNYMTIHFMAGTFNLPVYYYCVGVNVSILLQPGWKLRGAGIDITVFQLEPTNLANHVTYMLWGPYFTGGPPVEGGVEVSDMTINCNLQNQSGATSISAIGLYGNDTRISRVKAINWGTTPQGAEMVVLWLQPGSACATNCH